VKLQETPRFVQHVSTGWVIGTSRQRVIMSVIERRDNAPVLVQVVTLLKRIVSVHKIFSRKIAQLI